MELHHIKYFMVIAEELNFTKAAQKLFVTQSALSQQIASLEKEFGVKLFVRSQKGLQLSEAGRIFYEEAKDIIALTERAFNRMRSIAMQEEGAKRLVIVATPMDNTLERIGFIEAFSSWRTEHPLVSTEFKRASYQMALNMLEKDEADIAILNLPSQAEVDKITYPYVTLCSDEMYIIISRNFFSEEDLPQLVQANKNIHFVLAQGDHRWNEHIKTNILNPTGLRYTTSYQKNYFAALDSVQMTGAAIITFKDSPSVVNSKNLYAISSNVPAAKMYTVAIFKQQSEVVDSFLSKLCGSYSSEPDASAGEDGRTNHDMECAPN